MILLTESPLSPSQNAAIDEAVGREFQIQDNTMMCGGILQDTGAQERQQAAEQMRYQLYLLDRSQHRMSIEECMAAMMDSPSTAISD